MVFTRKDCGIKFLSASEFEHHKQTHYQTHLNKWSSKPDKINWKAPDGLNPALFTVFKKYRLGNQAMLCLWYNGQLKSVTRYNGYTRSNKDVPLERSIFSVCFICWHTLSNLGSKYQINQFTKLSI